MKWLDNELGPFSPVSDEMILAAVLRARRHEGRVRMRHVANHLGFAHSGAATRRLRPQLESLRADGLVSTQPSKGRDVFDLTSAGSRRIGAARRAGELDDLPEAPQHRRWRRAQAAAGEHLPAIIAALADDLTDADAIDVSDLETLASEDLFRLSERLHWNFWRLGCAVHCERVARADRRPQRHRPGEKHLYAPQLARLRAARDARSGPVLVSTDPLRRQHTRPDEGRRHDRRRAVSWGLHGPRRRKPQARLPRQSGGPSARPKATRSPYTSANGSIERTCRSIRRAHAAGSSGSHTVCARPRSANGGEASAKNATSPHVYWRAPSASTGNVLSRSRSTPGHLMSEEQNKAAAREVFAIWTEGDVDRLDELVAGDVVHHDPYDSHAADGREGMKATIRETRVAFPDLTLEVVDQVSEGDKVVTRWQGTMSFGGKGEPRGNISGITIDRFSDGFIVEAWRCQDRLGLLCSLGALADD